MNIFVLNGMARAGKDTFVSYVGKYINAVHISIVDKVKETAKQIGWNGEKDEKGRKLLSDIKLMTDAYDDRNYEYVRSHILEFINDNTKEALFIDMREQKDIQRVKDEFNIKSVFVKNNNVKNITSNIADANVFNIEYDIIIDNSGTLTELEEIAKDFIDKCIRR